MAIGAGGGTIAWVDAGGSLRCGPQSAGADPRAGVPRSGQRERHDHGRAPVPGAARPGTYLGGDVPIDPELADRRDQRLGRRTRNVGSRETAAGILRIADTNMTRATHLISVERGYDPRDFVLVAGGGAGPLHAAEIAQELGIPQVIVAPTPGVTSALGILQVDLRHDLLRPVSSRRTRSSRTSSCRCSTSSVGGAPGPRSGESPGTSSAVEFSLDIRYYGQTPYMNIVIDEAAADRAASTRLVELYGERYEREFGYQLDPDLASVEIVNARVAAIGRSPASRVPRGTEANGRLDPHRTPPRPFAQSRRTSSRRASTERQLRPGRRFGVRR